MSDFDRPVTVRDLDVLHETFIAYGDPAAPYWFVGLEENADPAAAPSLDSFVRKLVKSSRRFRKAGKLSLDDLCSSGSWTGYQTTWGAYVKLLFAIERADSRSDLPWTLDEVRRFQRNHLGALDAPEGLPRTCLMELFALARNRKRPWPYRELAEREGLGYLTSARRYEEHVVDARVTALLALADKHEPRFLVCFGNPCKDVLGPRLGVRPEKVELDVRGKNLPVRLVERGATTIVFARHPAAHSVSNGYWVSLGRLLAARQGAGPARKAA